MNMFQRGMRCLAKKLEQHASQRFLYGRGASRVEIAATLGTSDLQSTDTEGVTTVIQTQDFIFKTSLLVLNGELTLPETGDRITQIVDGRELIFKAVSSGSLECYRFCDAERTLLRVHTLLESDEIDV